MTQKWLLVILRLAPFAVILYEVLVSKLPVTFILPILWIEELLALPMVLVITFYTLSLARQDKLEDAGQIKIRRIKSGVLKAVFIGSFFFLAHTFAIILMNAKISSLEYGREIDEALWALFPNIPKMMFHGNSISEGVSFFQRSLLIMIGFHVLELYFILGKIKSEKDYLAAVSRQGQPLLFNHVLLVFGGGVFLFPPGYVFLALYAVRFLSIMGYFDWLYFDFSKPSHLTISELNQRQPLYSKDFPLEINIDSFWEKVYASIGQPGQAVLLYCDADNQSQGIKAGTLLEINKSVDWEKLFNGQKVIETSTIKGKAGYLQILKHEPNTHFVFVMGSGKEAIYIDVDSQSSESSSIIIKVYLPVKIKTEVFLSLVKTQLEKLVEPKITALLNYLSKK